MRAKERGAKGRRDWTVLRDEILRVTTAGKDAGVVSIERSREIMDERARELARRPEQDGTAGETIEVLVFALANERYAIETKFVHEVARFDECVPVPLAPAMLVGIAQLRGDLLAVFDLRRFLGLTSPGLTDLSRVIVVGTDHQEFGLLADDVIDVVPLRTSEFKAMPEKVSLAGRNCMLGVTDDALIVLRGSALLADTRLFINQLD